MLREELSIKDARWQRQPTRKRPHYTPAQRMRILQLRAARGWTIEQTAERFLLAPLTLQLWMDRLDEHGERAFIETAEPVNKFPDFVRVLVRQLKLLLPSMGSVRIAQLVARIGIRLSATSVRRMARERPPSDDDCQWTRSLTHLVDTISCAPRKLRIGWDPGTLLLFSPSVRPGRSPASSRSLQRPIELS